MMKCRTIIEPDEDVVFIAEFPALPGCISPGGTHPETLDHIKEAIELYLESLEALNPSYNFNFHE